MDGVLRASSVDRLRWTRYAPAGVAAVTAGASMLLIAMVDPNQPGNFPRCPFLALTGLYCPGCGSTRALHALAHGDFVSSAAYNPLTVGAVLVLAWWWVRWTRRIHNERPRLRLAPPIVLWAFIAMIGAFWVLRNLPLGAALAP
jgi:hypothetical protein